MWMKVREIGQGVHHSEVVVEIKTMGGVERIVLDKRAIKNGEIEVGNPLAMRDHGQLLVELPREAMSGAARVWVKQDSLARRQSEARAA